MTLDTGVSFATAYTSGYSALLIQKHKDNNTDYNKTNNIRIKKDLEKKYKLILLFIKYFYFRIHASIIICHIIVRHST